MSVIQNALTHALGRLEPAWTAITRLATTLWHRVLSLWFDVRERHERLMDTDPRYPVALATGGTAAVKVFITNPAVVKAVGVLLTELLDAQEDRPRPITRPSHLPSGYRDDAYRPTTSWSSGQLGSSLWDRDDWDTEE